MMDESGVSPIDHFIKQRRNLILISLLVIFAHAANVTFERSMNFLGFGIAVGNPRVIPTFMVIVFFYFCWRYVSSLNAIEGFSRMGMYIEERTSKYARLYLIKTVCQKTKLQSFEFQYNKQKQYDQYGDVIQDYRYHLSSLKSDISSEKKKALGLFKSFEVKGWPLFILKLKALILSVIYDVAFAEYIFPILLAMLAFLEICGLQVAEVVLLRISSR